MCRLMGKFKRLEHAFNAIARRPRNRKVIQYFEQHGGREGSGVAGGQLKARSGGRE